MLAIMFRITRVAAAAMVAFGLIAKLGAIEPERDFSGSWILDAGSSNQRALPDQPDQRLTVVQQEVAVRYSAPAADGSSVQWSYLLDGTETRSQIGPQTRSSVAKWEGAALLINTLVSGPRNYTVMDRWKLSRDRSVLTITRQIVERSGEVEVALVYRREGQPSVTAVPSSAPAAAATTVARPPSPTPSQTALPALVRRADPPAVSELTVVAGTHIALTLRNAVDTKHSHGGDRIYLATAFPIAVDGRIVIPRGSFVNGTITQSKPAHGVNGKGEMFIRFDTLVLPNGVSRDFRARLTSADSTARGRVDPKEGKVTGERDTSSDARTVALGTGIGASVGGIAGSAAGHGLGGAGIGAAAGAAAGLASVFHSKRPDAVLPQGTTVEMVLDRDLQFSAADLQ
jgi:type IV secretion system protein VirB10